MLQIVMAFAPLVFLILYALKTRKMADAMVLATLLAMVLLHRQHFLTGTIDAMYAALSNSSYQFALCVIIGFGGMITLFQESGALMGFRDLLLKIASGPKRTLVLAWLMSAIMFLDEYLSVLTVTFSMRGITDKNRIPREHLALQANIIACCLCVAVPFSSWTAFSVGLISAHGLGFSDYVRAIPYMFYPLGMMLLCLLLAVGAAVVVALALAGVVKELLAFLGELGSASGVSADLFVPLYKTIGIALVVQVGGKLCRDAGESALASVVETAGTLCALLAALPLLRAVLDMLLELMG